MFLFTYVMGMTDDVFIKNYYKGVWYKDIICSSRYYLFWVLPYWWFFIIIGTIVLAIILYFLKIGIGKLIS